MGAQLILAFDECVERSFASLSLFLDVAICVPLNRSFSFQILVFVF